MRHDEQGGRGNDGVEFFQNHAASMSRRRSFAKPIALRLGLARWDTIAVRSIWPETALGFTLSRRWRGIASTVNEPSKSTDGDVRPKPDDPLAVLILSLVAARGADKSICPSEAARAFAEQRAKPGDPPDVWRRYLTAVRQQALHLARAGRLVILRKGVAQDPHAPIKGVIRLSLPR